MDNEFQTLLTEARALLAEAKTSNENGQHGEAMKTACHASEQIASAYLLLATGQHMPQNDTTYDLFAKTIREPNRHPASLQAIKQVVGDVCALREIYEPALLDETTHKDAKQMIDCVSALIELVR